MIYLYFPFLLHKLVTENIIFLFHNIFDFIRVWFKVFCLCIAIMDFRKLSYILTIFKILFINNKFSKSFNTILKSQSFVLILNNYIYISHYIFFSV